MKISIIIGLFTALLFALPNQEIKLLFSTWSLIEPIISTTTDNSQQTEKKDNQTIKKVSLEYSAANIYKSLGMIINLPYLINMESVGTKQKYRTSQEDLSIYALYNKFGLTVKSGISIPMGYNSHYDSLWVGSGSYIFRSSLSGGKYLSTIKTSIGGEVGFSRYLNNSQVGFGSYESYLKSYISKLILGMWAGIEAGYFYKSINYKQNGKLISTNEFGIGYGEPFKQGEIVLGTFISRSINKNHEIALGGNKTVYRNNAALAYTLWMQFKYSL